MIITSSSNDKIKELKKLKDRSSRDLNRLFLVEGEHLVKEAYRCGLLIEIILDENATCNLDIKTTLVSNKVMKELSSLTTPTIIIGVCKMKDINPSLGDHILLLDGVQDPGNLGTIIRSAVAFNIDTIILGNGTVDVYNPKVIRATQGLLFYVNIFESDLETCISTIKNDGYKVIGTDMVDGIEISSYHAPDKYALIMGNEGNGISSNVNNLCDDFTYIDMNNQCESLNVAVACSIILYQLTKR